MAIRLVPPPSVSWSGDVESPTTLDSCGPMKPYSSTHRTAAHELKKENKQRALVMDRRGGHVHDHDSTSPLVLHEHGCSSISGRRRLAMLPRRPCWLAKLRKNADQVVKGLCLLNCRAQTEGRGLLDLHQPTPADFAVSPGDRLRTGDCSARSSRRQCGVLAQPVRHALDVHTNPTGLMLLSISARSPTPRSPPPRPVLSRGTGAIRGSYW